jgi:autoinducer 2-degrading protein
MVIVHVLVHVKPESVDAFREATLVNARTSCGTEPGVVRFDVLQQHDDPTRFVLVEVYRTTDDAAQHKTTVHYQTWRDAVAPMMAESRLGIRYANLFPDDEGWRRTSVALREVSPKLRPTRVRVADLGKS